MLLFLAHRDIVYGLVKINGHNTGRNFNRVVRYCTAISKNRL